MSPLSALDSEVQQQKVDICLLQTQRFLQVHLKFLVWHTMLPQMTWINMQNFDIRVQKKNINKIVLATLYINLSRNKVTSLIELVAANIDILVIEETKIDLTFPKAQFYIPECKKPFRKDRNAHG